MNETPTMISPVVGEPVRGSAPVCFAAVMVVGGPPRVSTLTPVVVGPGMVVDVLPAAVIVPGAAVVEVVLVELDVDVDVDVVGAVLEELVVVDVVVDVEVELGVVVVVEGGTVDDVLELIDEVVVGAGVATQPLSKSAIPPDDQFLPT